MVVLGGRQPVALADAHLDLLERLFKIIDGAALPSGDSCSEDGWPCHLGKLRAYRQISCLFECALCEG